ncbi:MAG: HDOD domain-containing protein [Granulosicoccus sp.]
MNEHQELISLIVKRLQDGDIELPVFDNIAVRLDREVRENKLDAALMCKILEEDPVLVSELLKVANSSYFSGLTTIANIREASVRLGLRQIAAIVFSVSQKKMYSASKGLFKKRLDDLWSHVSAVSLGCRWVAANTGHRPLADEAFVTGLLHDVGKLSILCIIEQLCDDNVSRFSNEAIDLALNELYCSHGGELVDQWNLPESFKTVVLHQNDEIVDQFNIILCIVRVVNRACLLLGISDTRHKDQSSDNPQSVLSSMPEAERIGLTDEDIVDLLSMLGEIEGKQNLAA